LIGIIPEDKNVIISTNTGVPVATDGKSLAGEAYRNVSLRLQGNTVPFMDLSKGSGLFGLISNVFGTGE